MKSILFSAYILATFLTSCAFEAVAREHPASGEPNVVATGADTMEAPSTAPLTAAEARTMQATATTTGEEQQHTTQGDFGTESTGQEMATTSDEPIIITSAATVTATAERLEPDVPDIYDDDTAMSGIGMVACMSAAMGSMLFIVVLARHHLAAQGRRYEYRNAWEVNQRYEMADLTQSRSFLDHRNYE